MIKINNVTKTYTHNNQVHHALQSINAEVSENEIIGIIGKSGAGKSTLLRCLNALEKPDQGEVWVNDQNLAMLSTNELTQARQRIGMIFQHFNLLSSKNVFDNIALPLQLKRQPKIEINRTVKTLIQLVGLQDHTHKYPSQLSGGQKQRVAIARALVNDPSVLLCDEFTSALDPETTRGIIKLLKKIQRERQITIVFITHDIEVIKQFADRVWVIDEGKLIEDQTVANLFKSPQTTFTQELIQASLEGELPSELKKRILPAQKTSDQAVIRIKFYGHPAVEPIIDRMIRQHNLRVNLYQAHLETIQKETIGTMLLSAQGDAHDLVSALLFLKKQTCQTQIVGYL